MNQATLRIGFRNSNTRSENISVSLSRGGVKSLSGSRSRGNKSISWSRGRSSSENRIRSISSSGGSRLTGSRSNSWSGSGYHNESRSESGNMNPGVF